jgi:signal transduction histidine kinase
MTGQTGKTTAGSRVKSWRKSGSRLALVAGFGALLVLMAVIGIDSLRTLGAFETNNTQIHQDFLYREHTLDQVRASLYESANMMSDYFLIESDPHVREALRAELQSIQAETTAALKSCTQSLPAEARGPFQHLGVEMEGYWSTIGPAFALDPEEKRRRESSVLRSAVLQQHAKVLTITKELSALNGDDLKEAERRIGEASGQFQRRLVMVVTIGLSFGLVLAAATIGYAGRLENRLEEKYEESLQAQGELRELSKRLVDTEERERRAISRELHDEVGQSLSALLLDLQNLIEISKGEGTIRQGLQNIKLSAENCLDEVRNMALLLRPSMLDDLGLVAALEWQAREVSKRTGMIVDMVDENVSDNLPEEHKTCVYRIVQEALNNCSKHAYAKNVRVIVRQDQDHLRVNIEDDGKGFDPRRVRGLGLVGMQERVTQLSGVLTVDSDPARGTRLEVDLPLPSA